MSTYSVTAPLNIDDMKQWLADYITFWSTTMSKPEDWSSWNNDPGTNISIQLANFKSLLATISQDQFIGLMQVMDSGQPTATPPIPPQPMIGKQLAIALLSAPFWLWLRLNYLYPIKGTSAGTLNWLFGLWNQAYPISNNFAIWFMTDPTTNDSPVSDNLNTWKSGSDADIAKLYTDPTGKVATPTNLHSIDFLYNRMKLLTILDDGSTNGHISDPTPSGVQGIVNSLLEVAV